MDRHVHRCRLGLSSLAGQSECARRCILRHWANLLPACGMAPQLANRLFAVAPLPTNLSTPTRLASPTTIEPELKPSIPDNFLKRTRRCWTSYPLRVASGMMQMAPSFSASIFDMNLFMGSHWCPVNSALIFESILLFRDIHSKSDVTDLNFLEQQVLRRSDDKRSLHPLPDSRFGSSRNSLQTLVAFPRRVASAPFWSSPATDLHGERRERRQSHTFTHFGKTQIF